MPTVLRAALVVARSVGAVGACHSDLGIVSDPIAEVLVLGTVRDSAGAGLPEVTVAFAAVPGTQCDVTVSFRNPVATNASGRFEASLLTLAREFEGCLRLQVTPAAGSGLRGDTVDRAGVRFRSGGQRDTVRVDVVLGAGA